MRVQPPGKITDGIAAVRQEGDRLISLQALGFEPREQASFRLGITTAHVAKARGGSALWRQALTHDHLKPPFGSGALVFRVDVDAVQADDQRASRFGLCRVTLAAGRQERVAPIAQVTFQAFGRVVHLTPKRPGTEGLADRQHLSQQLKGQPVRHQGRELGLQVGQLGRRALRQ
jgi:hypothetical protein